MGACSPKKKVKPKVNLDDLDEEDKDNLDEDDRDFIDDFVKKGKTVSFIANKLDKSEKVVQAYLAKSQVDKFGLDEDDQMSIDMLFEGNRPIEAIAKKLKIKKEVVKAYLESKKKEEAASKDEDKIDEDDCDIIDNFIKQGKPTSLIAKKLNKSEKVIEAYLAKSQAEE